MVNARAVLGSFRGAVARMERSVIRESFVRSKECPGLRFAPSGLRKLILGRENPIAARLQADDLAGLEFPVPRRVDLDHGLALAARERDLRPLDRAEGADMAHRA